MTRCMFFNRRLFTKITPSAEGPSISGRTPMPMDYNRVEQLGQSIGSMNVTFSAHQLKRVQVRTALPQINTYFVFQMSIDRMFGRRVRLEQ